jgi:uncharacterized membrane protein YhaH (DUF805 family)
MTDRLQRATGGFKPFNWLAGRSGRKEYWLYIGVFLAFSALMAILRPDFGQAGAFGFLVAVWARRFHDLGRTGWWALAVVAVQFALIVPAMGLGEDAVLLVSAATSTLAIVVMGAIPGQPHDNLFGPPQGRRPVSETFS